MTGDPSLIQEYLQQMAETITQSVASLDPDRMILFFDEMLTARRVYVTGAGRSGLIARAFAMRLMHIGYDAYVVGETVTPAMRAGDTLVVFSGSGATGSILNICMTAKELQGRICLITASPESKMATLADCVVDLGDETGYYHRDRGAFEVRQITGQYRSVVATFAPLGTLFETLALVFSDAVISSLLQAKHEDISEVKSRLSNVQ